MRPGEAKVTAAFGTGLPPASLTVATKGAAKFVLMVALWGVPAVAVIDAAAPILMCRLSGPRFAVCGVGLESVTLNVNCVSEGAVPFGVPEICPVEVLKVN